MNTVHKSRFGLLLEWLRADESHFEHGYTAGYLHAIAHELEPWQFCYLKNVQRRIATGDRA